MNQTGCFLTQVVAPLTAKFPGQAILPEVMPKSG
jgi:hypothetical protein